LLQPEEEQKNQEENEEKMTGLTRLGDGREKKKFNK
jgi:hypothetical protein